MVAWQQVREQDEAERKEDVEEEEEEEQEEGDVDEYEEDDWVDAVDDVDEAEWCPMMSHIDTCCSPLASLTSVPQSALIILLSRHLYTSGIAYSRRCHTLRACATLSLLDCVAGIQQASRQC